MTWTVERVYSCLYPLRVRIFVWPSPRITAYYCVSFECNQSHLLSYGEVEINNILCISVTLDTMQNEKNALLGVKKMLFIDKLKGEHTDEKLTTTR